MNLLQEKQEKTIKQRVVQSKHQIKDENDLAPSAKRSRHTLSERNYDGDHELSFSTTPRRSDAVNQLLNRQQLLVQRPVCNRTQNRFFFSKHSTMIPYL